MMPLSIAVIALSVLGLVSGEDSCFATASDKCENFNRGRISTVMNGGIVDYTAACESIKKRVACGIEAECEEGPWDPTDDFLSYMLQFTEESGLCGGESQVSECGRRVSQTCLNDLVVGMKGKDACSYYGDYAACLIRETVGCDDETLMIVATLMMDQLADNYPTVVGGTTTASCPNWSTKYAKFVVKK